MKDSKIILIIAFAILCVLSGFAGIYLPNSKLNEAIDETKNIVQQELVVSEETEQEASDTKDVTLKGKDVSTKETIKSTATEEKEVTDEGALETDAVVEQENISYNGDVTGKGLNLLGAYQGLTYYSQKDSRWANVMYSSINDKSQTMKSSACGPTSASMVVSSSKGAILPTTMARLSVDNGYRTASNGTAWSFYSFVADYFDFNEYHSTGNFDTAMTYLSQKNLSGSSKYYIIASCGSGLFTTGGHYIALMGLDNGTITVYDPYVYSTKFTTASRKKANVKLDGNIAYVSRSNFKKYANYKNFWVFSNDEGKGNPNKSTYNQVNESTNTSTSNTTKNTQSSYTRYVNTKSANLNVRKTAGGKIIGSLKKGTKVTVVGVEGNWSKISSPVSGYVSSSYLSIISPNNISTTYVLGKYKVNTSIGLRVRTGPGTNYKIKKVYPNGTRFDTYQIKGSWAKTPSGWICLDYCKLVNRY